MNDAITEFWNTRDPDAFDAGVRRSGRMEAVRRVATISKPHVHREGAVSIDLGCGTGLFSEAAGVRDIIGVDFSSSLLDLAKTRMNTVLQKNIFDLTLAKDSVDNAISLFVIDDYPSERKRAFFSKVFSFLKPGGHFFFAAYSPRDERMGKMREAIDSKAGARLEVHLEDSASYEDKLKECGFIIDSSEVFRTHGVFGIGFREMKLRREFIIISARKPDE